uniref:Uncharacterized protein n=1 Tax=Solanum lycopersicum TaxID=4081 RepID=A0A3Q7H9T0_SOLLC
MSIKKMSITEFVKNYEQQTIEMFEIEAIEDYKFRGDPKIFIEDCGILKHAARVHTRRIYTRSQREILQGTTKRVNNVETEGSLTKYTIL